MIQGNIAEELPAWIDKNVNWQMLECREIACEP